MVQKLREDVRVRNGNMIIQRLESGRVDRPRGQQA